MGSYDCSIISTDLLLCGWHDPARCLSHHLACFLWNHRIGSQDEDRQNTFTACMETAYMATGCSFDSHGWGNDRPSLSFHSGVSMNIRLQKYKKNRLKGMNQYNAAIAAGYSHSTAWKSNRLEKGVKGCMADLLEQAGLTDKYLVQFMKKGLNAKKLYGKDAAIKHADWGARHKFAETILKMSGKLKVEVEGENGNKVLPNITLVFTSQKVGAEGVRTTETFGEGDLLARKGVDSNRIKEQV